MDISELLARRDELVDELNGRLQMIIVRGREFALLDHEITLTRRTAGEQVGSASNDRPPLSSETKAKLATLVDTLDQELAYARAEWAFASTPFPVVESQDSES